MDIENRDEDVQAEKLTVENQLNGDAAQSDVSAGSAEASANQIVTEAPPKLTPVAEMGVQPASIQDAHSRKPLNANQLMINYLVVALVFLGIGVLFGRLIFGGTNTNANMDEALLREIVAEAVSSSQTNSSDAQTSQLVDDDPVIGADDAAITIVEFSDFNCGFCGRFAADTLPRLLTEYEGQIRFVYRDMPIIGGQNSVEAAIAAECAADQEQFTEYHNLLFANTTERTREAFIGFATELGLDEAAFTSCLDDQAKSDEVLLDLLDGQSLGITGTPGFYVNGRFISGAQPYEIFKTIIDRELQQNEL
jgi:protein-disulfide isomerase